MIFSLHPSAPQPYYYSSPIYPGQRLVYLDADEPSYPSYLPRVSDPSTRYRRALAEYLAAEEEYNAVLRAREEAALRARAEAFRQERVRFLQARQLEQALAQATVDLSPPSVVPVVCSLPKRCGSPLPDVLASRRSRAHTTHVDGATEIWKELLGSLCESAHQQPADDGKVCGVAILSADHSDTPDKAQPDHDAKRDEVTTLILERLRECLQRSSDDEVQDVACALLRRLGQPNTMDGVSEPAPAASSPEVSRHPNPIRLSRY
jgi:hypothetical protein